MQHVRLLSIALAVAGLASVAEAKPKPKAKPKAGAKATTKAELKVHVDKATKAHKEGKFDVALTELQAAYDIDPQPKLLFAIAQVQAKLGDCPAAVDNYNKFLGTTKDKQKQEVVKQAITACKDKPAAVATADKPDSSVFRKEKEKEKEPAPPPTPLPAVEATPPAPPPPEPTPTPTPPTPTPTPPSPITKFDEPPKAAPAPAPHHERFYKDILGDVLVLAGVGAGAFSYIEYRAATKDLDAADAQHSSLDAYNDLVNSAHDKRKISVILAGGGVALVGAGVLRWALHGSGESHAVALVPTHSGGLITWTGGF